MRHIHPAPLARPFSKGLLHFLGTPNPQPLITNPCFQTCSGGFAAMLDDRISVSSAPPRGKGAPKGRIGHKRYAKRGAEVFQSLITSHKPSPDPLEILPECRIRFPDTFSAFDGQRRTAFRRDRGEGHGDAVVVPRGDGAAGEMV